MTALLLALLSLPATITAAVPLEPVPVLATSYTCQDHPANAMFPCSQTRWGADPATDGMACPSCGRVWAYSYRGGGYWLVTTVALLTPSTACHTWIYEWGAMTRQ